MGFLQYAVYHPRLASFLCVFVRSSLEFFLLYEAATVHVQNLEDPLDVFSCHGLQSHHLEELFGVECFCYKGQDRINRSMQTFT